MDQTRNKRSEYRLNHEGGDPISCIFKALLFQFSDSAAEKSGVFLLRKAQLVDL
ncbi:MAG: hypothetical protein ACEY3J_02490 [Arsenophonus sp.]